jgi:hypothetical protein
MAIVAIPGALLLLVALTNLKQVQRNPLLWALVVLVPLIGPLLYFAIESSQRAQKLINQLPSMPASVKIKTCPNGHQFTRAVPYLPNREKKINHLRVFFH